MSSKPVTLQQEVMSFVSTIVNRAHWDYQTAHELVRKMLNAKWNELPPITRDADLDEAIRCIGLKMDVRKRNPWTPNQVMWAEIGEIQTLLDWISQQRSAAETRARQLPDVCAHGVSLKVNCAYCDHIHFGHPLPEKAEAQPQTHRECRFDEHAGACTWIGCPNNSPGSPTHCPLPWPRASEKTTTSQTDGEPA